MEFSLINFVKFVSGPDFNFMHQTLIDRQIGYTSSYDNLMDKIFIWIDDVILTCTHLNESSSGYSNLPMTGSVRFVIELLRSLLSIESSKGNTWFRNAPSGLVGSKQFSNECNRLLMKVKDHLEFLSRQVPAPLNESTTLVRSVFDDSEYFYKRTDSYVCGGEFSSVMNSIMHIFDKLHVDIGRFDDTIQFYDKKYLEAIKLYLVILRDTKSVLSEKLFMYSENRTTQLKLAKEITHSTLFHVGHTTGLIMSAVKKKCFGPLKFAIYRTAESLKRWYAKTLKAMQILSPYYDDSDIEDKMRALKIWRHPVARLATSDILQFKYPVSEFWRSWEGSVSLEDFVRSGNATALIRTIVEDYARVVRNDLLKLELKYINTKDDVVQAFRDIIRYFSDIHSKSLMDENFVK